MAMLTSYFMLILCARSVVLFRTSTCLRDNEEFSLCGWRCPATCVNLRFLPTDLCPSTWDCRVGCRCAAGFVRDEYSKQCVLVQDCPDNRHCPPGEILGTNLQCISRTHAPGINESYWTFYDNP
ncbi:uncharacterized protein LOC124631137 [Helicoverpa zea]|uniref:uncharacterized protein LOC124631137 n=1 Tax=Helicoverpa zea TaxID=7113 RepID=UPI001F571210|nr:uncharacterized protein LOC124631137 [Helicoverpa zea]